MGVLLTALLLGWAWFPAFDAPYQYDDTVTPLKDPASQSLAAWVRELSRTLRPLTKLSYALESSLGASSAPARRVLNGLLFSLATALLARLLARSGIGWGLAVGFAAAWALHPVHAETIVALAGRSVLLSLTLCLASAVYALEERPWAAVTCALLALLARETALPWFVCCSWWVSASHLEGRARRVLFLAACAGGSALALAAPRMRQLLVFSWGDSSVGDRLGLQWAALPRGVVMWLCSPQAFSVDIEFAPRGVVRLLYLLASLGLYAAFVWLAVHSSNRLVRLSALLWLCLVIPLHSVVPKLDPLTARGVSAHSAALMVLFAAWLGEALRERPRSKSWIWIALAVSFAVLAPITRQRAALYRDPIALWRDAAERGQTSSRPLVNLGTLLAQQGQLREAHASLREAIRRNPHDTDARERLMGVESLLETQHLLMEPAR